jgi:hypothetical protein
MKTIQKYEKKRGRERKSNGGGEFDQSTCMDISQWNTFLQLIHTNKVIRTAAGVFKYVNMISFPSSLRFSFYTREQ